MASNVAVARGQAWVDANVLYNQAICASEPGGYYRLDCSGFVSMAWKLPSSLITTDFNPAYSGNASFVQIARSQLQPGDAVVDDASGNPGDSGEHHIALFAQWGSNDHGQSRYADLMEESEPGVGTILDANADLQGSYWGAFTPIHYVNVTQPAPPVVPQSTLGEVRAQSGNLVWHLSNNFSGTTTSTLTYGVAGDIPVSGDWDGNGTDTPGVVRQVGSNFVFYLTNDLSGTGATAYHVTYGVPGDIPVVGDWDNDGTDTPGVVRQVGGDLVWYLTNSLSGTGSTWTHVTYGAPGDVPVAGDWDGDGSDTPGVVRSIGGIYQWHVSNNLAGTTSATVAYGQTGDTPVAGDWDHNGTSTPAAVRPVGTTAVWHLSNSLTGTSSAAVTYGLNTDSPVAGHWG